MDLPHNLLLLLSLIHHAAAHDIVATCVKTNDLRPAESQIKVDYNPSPLHDLDLQLIDQSRPVDSLALNIRWSINIDSSIHSITGTWIDLIIRSHTKSYIVNYRCDYQPAFTSNQNDYTGFEELWFNFTSTDVQIEPTGVYTATVYNLPIPPIHYSKTPSISKFITAPGCDDKRMRNEQICSDEKPLTISAVLDEDEIVVSFVSQAGSQEYTIMLRKERRILNRNSVKTDEAVRTVIEKYQYSGHCENLTVWVRPHFRKCGGTCTWVSHDVDCKTEPDPELEHKPKLELIPELEPEAKPETTPEPKLEEKKPEKISLLPCIIGCAVAALFMLIGLCYFYRRKKHGRTLIVAGQVRVLLVYPAVDSVFQHAVMALADFLQSHKDLNIVIDMWHRSSLAEQGPLRWLHSQADQSDKVLIISPPQHIHTGTVTDTDHQKLHMVPGRPDYTVPASAQELFSLALNLVASNAHDLQQRHKFWVVRLGQSRDKGTVPVQLQGCKILNLPRDLEKLHQKLTSRQGKKCPRLSCSIWSFHCSATSRKVREAVLQLDSSHPNCSKEETAHLTEVKSKL